MLKEIEIEFDELDMPVHRGCGGFIYRSLVDGRLTCLGCGASFDEEFEDLEETDDE